MEGANFSFTSETATEEIIEKLVTILETGNY